MADGRSEAGLGYGRRSMSSHHSALRRVLVSAVLCACTVVVAAPAGAAEAVPWQDDPSDSEPSDSDDVFDANETEGTIERVRYQLLAVAAVTGVLLVGYIWHTDPQRRLRVATRRREDRERAGVAALEDEFMLPGEVDVADVLDATPDAVADAADATSDAVEGAPEQAVEGDR